MPSQQMIDGQLELMGWRGGFADRVVNQPGHLLAGIDLRLVAWIVLNENLYHIARNDDWRWVGVNNGYGYVNEQGPIGLNAVPAVQKGGHKGLTILDGSNTPRPACVVRSTHWLDRVHGTYWAFRARS